MPRRRPRRNFGVFFASVLSGGGGAGSGTPAQPAAYTEIPVQTVRRGESFTINLDDYFTDAVTSTSVYIGSDPASSPDYQRSRQFSGYYTIVQPNMLTFAAPADAPLLSVVRVPLIIGAGGRTHRPFLRVTTLAADAPAASNAILFGGDTILFGGDSINFGG